MLFEARKKDLRRLFVLPEHQERFKSILDWASKRGLFVRVVEAAEISRVAGTEHHEGVCFEAKPLPCVQLGDIVRIVSDLQRGVVMVLDGVDNPHNVGAILRTASFFGVSAVVIRSQVISTLSGAACRVAEGAAEQMPICIARDYGNFFAALKARGFGVVATTPHEARSLYSRKWPEKLVLMFGAEGSGLTSEGLAIADQRAAIPRVGSIESLNVSAAVSSVLTEARREAIIRGHVRRVQAPTR